MEQLRTVDLNVGPLARMRAALAVPQGDLARRLTLLGLVLALQNALELPRGGVAQVLGNLLTSVLVVAALTGSLALLVLALRARVPGWRWLGSRRVQALVLVATLAAVPTGVLQLGRAAVAGFQPPIYSNDGTTLDHYAALQLLEGHDPYVTTDIVAAVHLLHQDGARTTIVRRGAFAAVPLTRYPSDAAVRAVFATQPVGHPDQVRSFESHLSYPALAFLPLVPFVWAGLPSVVPFFALCFLAFAALLLAALPREWRPWIALALLADAPLLDATLSGDLDVLYVLLLFVAWRWSRRPLTSALALGLALAAKQLAWFYLPFYAILVARERGWRAAAGQLAGAGAVFAVINGPFILHDPRAWLAGVLAPQVDPLFPMGNGLIRLSLGGLVPLAPSLVYGALEGLAIVACVVWYWREGRRMPELGFVLAVLPLYFAWRSLTTYFYFVALPSLVLLLARTRGAEPAGAEPAGAEPTAAGAAWRPAVVVAQTYQQATARWALRADWRRWRRVGHGS